MQVQLYALFFSLVDDLDFLGGADSLSGNNDLFDEVVVFNIAHDDYRLAGFYGVERLGLFNAAEDLDGDRARVVGDIYSDYRVFAVFGPYRNLRLYYGAKGKKLAV